MERIAKISTALLAFVLLIAAGCATMSTSSSEKKSHHHDRIIAIGDVHGNYSGLVSIMREASLIDDKNHWIGGNALMVQTGDLLDRGSEVRNVLDLLMKLEAEAKTAGGRVVVIMGNHEAMNIWGLRDYVNPEVYAYFTDSKSEEKQQQAFERWKALFASPAGSSGEDAGTRQQNWLSEHPPGFVEYTESMGPDGRYGKWLRRLPFMFRYGGTLFFHAGISPQYVDKPLDDINRMIAAEIDTFDENKSYLMKLGFIEEWFSMPEITAVINGILAAAETKEPSPFLRDIMPRIKEIKAFLDQLDETSPLLADEGPLWFRGLADSPDDKISAYLSEWLEKNNAWRIVVGHTPRSDGRVQSRLEGALFLIDTGMNVKYYKFGRASALEIRNDEVTAIYEGGERYPFPPPKIDYGPVHVWTGPDGTPLPFQTMDGFLEFLGTAEPVEVETIRAITNRPKKILLKKDGLEVNAAFRYESTVENSRSFVSDAIKNQRYFRDSYLGEIAAFEMNRFLGLNNMPPTVIRTVNGKQGTLQLWAEGSMRDKERVEQNINPPEELPVRKQDWDMDIFDNLINNFDRNQTNILYDSNWRVILIDHTRSFARDTSLPNPEKVVRCSRGLWHSLRYLDETAVRNRLSPYLSKLEIDALFVRRDHLVQLIQDIIDQKGEENVLF